MVYDGEGCLDGLIGGQRGELPGFDDAAVVVEDGAGAVEVDLAGVEAFVFGELDGEASGGGLGGDDELEFEVGDDGGGVGAGAGSVVGAEVSHQVAEAVVIELEGVVSIVGGGVGAIEFESAWGVDIPSGGLLRGLEGREPHFFSAAR